MDTTYPFMVTKQGAALNFINSPKLFDTVTDTNHKNHCDSINNSETEEPLSKKLKLENGESQYFISLRDPK